MSILVIVPCSTVAQVIAIALLLRHFVFEVGWVFRAYTFYKLKQGVREACGVALGSRP